MAPLMPAYTAGDLLVAHATGSVDTSRSHFDAQRYIEVGKPQDLNLVDRLAGPASRDESRRCAPPRRCARSG